MKNFSQITNGILAAAIIVLFASSFASCSDKANTDNNVASNKFTGGDSTGLLPIAYVNIDSLLSNYNYFKDANDVLLKKYNSSNATLSARQRQLQSEYADFDKKLKNNAFLSQDRAEQEAARIRGMEAELQKLAQKYQEDFMKEQQDLNAKIADSVRVVLKEYNKTANYQMIFSNNGLDNILLAKDGYDITDKIITLLNSRYKAEPAK